jgi:hypothetical protein
MLWKFRFDLTDFVNRGGMSDQTSRRRHARLICGSIRKSIRQPPALQIKGMERQRRRRRLARPLTAQRLPRLNLMRPRTSGISSPANDKQAKKPRPRRSGRTSLCESHLGFEACSRPRERRCFAAPILPIRGRQRVEFGRRCAHPVCVQDGQTNVSYDSRPFNGHPRSSRALLLRELL